MFKACLLVVFVATCTCGNYLRPDAPQEELQPFLTGGTPEDTGDIPDFSDIFDEEHDVDDTQDDDLDPEDASIYDDGDLTNFYDKNELKDVDYSEDAGVDHDQDGIDDHEAASSEDDDDEVEQQPGFYQPIMWPFINGFHDEIPGLNNPWVDDDDFDRDHSTESDHEDSYDHRHGSEESGGSSESDGESREARSLSVDKSEEREPRSLSGEEPNERQARAVAFVSRVARLGLAALKGSRVRQTLLRGTTVMRKHGHTTHYEKTGNANTMLKDFYSSKPTNIKDDVIDGAYVGKIGMVGDRKIHYFLHDEEHVYLKPLLSIQKMDKDGKVLVKDVIHYTDN